MSPMLRGFAEELIKTSAAYEIPARGLGALGRNILGIAEKPGVRRALKHGGMLGALQGGVSGAASGEKGSKLKSAIKGAVGGGAAGALGGAAFPHWFA